MSDSPSGSHRAPSRARKLSSKLSLSNLSSKSGGGSRKGAATPSQRSFKETSSYQGISHRQQLSQVSALTNSSVKSIDGNTIAHLYAVFGLPKDPAVWTLAEEDCVAGVHHIEGAVGRFWRPEVLGCSISPPPNGRVEATTTEEISRTTSDASAGKKAGSSWDADGKKGSNPKYIEMSDGRGGLEKAETARVLSKALKLSFTREIEVTAGPGNYPPMSTSHTFSFSVPTIKSSTRSFNARRSNDVGKVGTGFTSDIQSNHAASAVGEGYGLEGVATGAAVESAPGVATFHGVVLTVWSAADDKRAKAIKKELSRAAKARAGKGGDDGAQNDDDVSSVNDDSFLPTNNTFFMPYAICLVSRYPIYNLLADWNKAAWHKYSRNIEMHNKLMAAILRQPAPRLGETFKLESPDEDLTFVCTFPGALDWGRGLISIDFVMWPLFKTLSIDNILTICEIALSPAGRVLFLSRQPALLGVAVETIKYLIELCGWRGVAHQICHARDVKIYLEDPGSWLIALNTELRSIAKPAKEVCLVDLDINFVNCPRPPPKAPSTRSVRDKKRRKLVNALGFSSADYGPPREITEAFPAGRLRPLSKVQAKSNGDSAPYDRVDTPHWWDQGAVLSAFDQVLHEGTKPSFLKKVLKLRTDNQVTASATEMAAIAALRKRASTFVDARDGLENKIGRLNKRLAFLMSEGDMWKQQFEKIQQLVDRLTKEANDLRLKVDRERRESRRLSTTLQQRDMEQVQIQLQLRETEQAREKAQAELVRMRDAMDTLEHEREAMIDEIRNVVSSSGIDDFDFGSLSKLGMMVDGASRVRSDSPGSAMSHNSELSIMKSRALAEQRISMGRPLTGSSPARAAGSSRLGHGSQSGHGQAGSSSSAKEARTDKDLSTSASFTDEQMNSEIQNRTSAVTDQISRIQQQLESTLTHLESRRSMTFERERRRSNASANSFRYDNMGPPSSIGHYGGASGNSVGHGAELGSPYTGGAGYEAVESIQDHNDSVDMRSTNSHGPSRRNGGAPPSSFRGTDASPGRVRQSTPRMNGTGPTFGPKHPARRISTAGSASLAHGEQDSPIASSSGGHELSARPAKAGQGESAAPAMLAAPVLATASVQPAASEKHASDNATGKDVPVVDAIADADPVAEAADTAKTAGAVTAAAAAASAAAAAGIAAVSSHNSAVEDRDASSPNHSSVGAEGSTADTLVAPAIKEAKINIEPPSDPPVADIDGDVTEARDAGSVADSDADEDGGLDMFAEPEDFRPKTPPPTVTYYDFPGNDAKVTLHLVGSHPLWGHLAWNASFVMSDFLCAHANKLTKGKKVLELGSAAGLPSIVCNWAEASHVVASDYPDPDLLGNLRNNIEYNCGENNQSEYKGPGYAAAEGYIWGTDPTQVLSHLSKDGSEKFDVILMSDLVFNHQAHPALLETCEKCLADPLPVDADARDEGDFSTPCVLVFFTHHRPHLAYKDMGFFDLAEIKGWKVQKLGEWFREPMFPDDPGDEQVRSTIHGYCVYKGTAADELDVEPSASISEDDVPAETADTMA